MAYGGNFAKKSNKGFSSSVTDWVRGGGVAGEGSDPYSDQFSMYPGGKGAPTAGAQNLFRTDSGRGNINFYGPGSGAQFKKDTTMKGRGGPNTFLGSSTGNVAYKAGIRLINGVVTRMSATDAILYETQSIPGTFGYDSGRTERFRNPYKSTGWKYQLTQSSGPNKGPHGFSQSSLDSTQEVYTTEETRFNKPGIYDTNEKWNSKTKRFERQWKGWKNLKVSKRWKHYTLSTATMFGAENKDVGAARRAKRSTM